MMEEGNGRATIREVYALLQDMRGEFGEKLDDIRDDLKEVSDHSAAQDLQLLSLSERVETLPSLVNYQCDSRIAKHVDTDHAPLTMIKTRVWVMWTIGIFVASTAGAAGIAALFRLLST